MPLCILNYKEEIKHFELLYYNSEIKDIDCLLINNIKENQSLENNNI